MFTYAGGSFITGPLGDRFSPSFIVGLGLLGSTVCLLLITIGASVPALADSASLGLFWFAGTQFIHGFFQATGGPVNTAMCVFLLQQLAQLARRVGSDGVVS